MNKNRVSVVIPFKDKLQISQLTQSVKALFDQSVLPDEIILVGDKDYLASLTISKKMSGVIKLIPFKGDKNQARNIGIKKAKGNYLLYLDHDMTADHTLVADCLNLSKEYDAIIIPEKGAGGNFWENCKKLEKELITYDTHTVTPRFFRKSLFRNAEQPFDSRFGLLDEWGFNHNLMLKKAIIGYSHSYVTVKESDMSLLTEVKNKFRRGLWMKSFSQIDKNEAWNRVNPIQRGLIFYSQKLPYLFKEPIYFPGLIFLKFVDFMAFMSGYLVGYLRIENA